MLGLLLLLLNLLQASLFPLPGVAVVCRNRAERERWEDDHDLVAVPKLANHWLAGGREHPVVAKWEKINMRPVYEDAGWNFTINS